MPFSSLGEFIKAADDAGEVEHVSGADLEVEIGCLTELVGEQGGPMLVFDNIPGFAAGYRVCSNAIKSARRFALALDLPMDVHPLELLRLWREKRKGAMTIPATVVKDGAVLEVVQNADGVNLQAFPAPRWHTGDGGHYIGTADNVITRDPDAGWINVGVYRGMVQSHNRLSLWINPMKHGRILVERYWHRGEAAPVAVVLGCEPVTWMSGSMSPPLGTSEYDVAGSFRGAPVEILRLPLTGLPVPAGAELVIEGFIPPVSEESANEGPFGEWPGYYTHQGPETVVRIERIYHRKNPIINGAPPLRPIGWSNITTFVQLWEHLERSGVSDVTGVWGFYNGLITVIALRQRYAGHAKQALITAAGFRHGDMKTYYVTVDEDIDPTNLNEVLWAMSTRVDPATAVDILHDCWTADLDPRISPARRAAGDLTVGRMLINACRPYTWRDNFPKTNVFSADERTRVELKWRDLLERAERKRKGSWMGV